MNNKNNCNDKLTDKCNETALVLEGGALRGLYTAGVLDVFMENDIKGQPLF